MAELPAVFNAEQHEALDDFSPIPAGTYAAEITKSEMKQTKAGDGSYLALTFKIIEGDFVKRMIWANLNLVNKSEKAVEISQKTLKSICDAVGMVTVTDSQQLHGRPMLIKVGIRKDENYGDSNVIKSFKAIDEVSASGAGNPFGD